MLCKNLCHSLGFGLNLGALCKDCTWVLRRQTYDSLLWLTMGEITENGENGYKAEWTHI